MEMSIRDLPWASSVTTVAPLPIGTCFSRQIRGTLKDQKTISFT